MLPEARRWQVHLAAANISNMDETLIRERAALREMLALELSANIVLETNHTAASPSETAMIPSEGRSAIQRGIRAGPTA